MARARIVCFGCAEVGCSRYVQPHRDLLDCGARKRAVEEVEPRRGRREALLWRRVHAHGLCSKVRKNECMSLSVPRRGTRREYAYAPACLCPVSSLARRTTATSSRCSLSSTLPPSRCSGGRPRLQPRATTNLGHPCRITCYTDAGAAADRVHDHNQRKSTAPSWDGHGGGLGGARRSCKHAVDVENDGEDEASRWRFVCKMWGKQERAVLPETRIIGRLFRQAVGARGKHRGRQEPSRCPAGHIAFCWRCQTCRFPKKHQKVLGKCRLLYGKQANYVKKFLHFSGSGKDSDLGRMTPDGPSHYNLRVVAQSRQ